MASYCISDIHGEKSAFHELLKVIHFSPSDTLYILGDVIDRGVFGLELLREMMNTPNIHVLLGNHELMMREYFDSETARGREKYQKRLLWHENNNSATLHAFMSLTKEERNETLDFLFSLPSHLDIKVGNQQFHLVHGFPGESIYDEVWGRPDTFFTMSPYLDRITVIGHTPVVLLKAQTGFEQEKYFLDLEKTGKHMEILHSPGGWIDIDCGISYPVPGHALACLCLDDMSETYITE